MTEGRMVEGASSGPGAIVGAQRFDVYSEFLAAEVESHNQRINLSCMHR
jgi:hypothetical protein